MFFQAAFGGDEELPRVHSYLNAHASNLTCEKSWAFYIGHTYVLKTEPANRTVDRRPF